MAKVVLGKTELDTEEKIVPSHKSVGFQITLMNTDVHFQIPVQCRNGIVLDLVFMKWWCDTGLFVDKTEQGLFSVFETTWQKWHLALLRPPGTFL